MQNKITLHSRHRLECATFLTIRLKCLFPFAFPSVFLLSAHVDVPEPFEEAPEPDTADVEALGAADAVDAALCAPEVTEGTGAEPPEGTDEGNAGGAPSAGVISPDADARFEIGGPGKVYVAPGL